MPAAIFIRERLMIEGWAAELSSINARVLSTSAVLAQSVKVLSYEQCDQRIL